MRRWTVPIAVALCALIAIALIAGMGRLIFNALNGSIGASTAGDPMFEAPVERVTRPPQLMDEAAEAQSPEEDPSRNWNYKTLTHLDAEGYAVE